MDFKELCRERESVRSYTSKEVEQEKLDYIMECVRLAPSAVNFQPWKFYVVKDEAGKQNVCKCYKRDWLASAPMYVIACVRHDEEWVRKMDGKAHGNIDVAIAVEHLCLAAAEQGLGTCWVCNFDAQLCHSLFDLPENEEAAVIVPIGYSDSDCPREKNRKEMGEILSNL
jgi:nitroreductase